MIALETYIWQSGGLGHGLDFFPNHVAFGMLPNLFVLKQLVHNYILESNKNIYSSTPDKFAVDCLISPWGPFKTKSGVTVPLSTSVCSNLVLAYSVSFSLLPPPPSFLPFFSFVLSPPFFFSRSSLCHRLSLSLSLFSFISFPSPLPHSLPSLPISPNPGKNADFLKPSERIMRSSVTLFQRDVCNRKVRKNICSLVVRLNLSFCRIHTGIVRDRMSAHVSYKTEMSCF